MLSLFRWGNWGKRGLNCVLKVTQLVSGGEGTVFCPKPYSGRTQIWTWGVWLQRKAYRLPKRNRLGYTQNKTGGILWFSFRMSIARTFIEDLVDWRKTYNPKVATYVLFRELTEDCSPGDSPQIALRNYSEEVREEPGYRGVFAGEKKKCSQTSKDDC